MRNNPAKPLKISPLHIEEGRKPAKLDVSKKVSNATAPPAVNLQKRFRGDILLYMIALGIWAFVSVWFLVRLIEKFG